VARQIYNVTAVAIGIALLCLAVLDWVGYTVFVLSLGWL
jgi:hypothetical protein